MNDATGAYPARGQEYVPNGATILLNPPAVLTFAECVSPANVDPATAAAFQHLVSLGLSSRIALETTPAGVTTWRFIPPAHLVGVTDEGIWPRAVDFFGHHRLLSQYEWDVCKLDRSLRCTIDLTGPHVVRANQAQSAANLRSTTPISPDWAAQTGQDPQEGSSTRPFVVDEPELPQQPSGASSSRLSPPLSDTDQHPKRFAATVETEPESDDESSHVKREDRTFSPPTPRAGAKRRASTSPEGAPDPQRQRYRSHSIISISSGSEDEKDGVPQRPRRGVPTWNYPRSAATNYGASRTTHRFANGSHSYQRRAARSHATGSYTRAQDPSHTASSSTSHPQAERNRSQSVPLPTRPLAGRRPGVQPSTADHSATPNNVHPKRKGKFSSTGSASPNKLTRNAASPTPEIIEIENPEYGARSKRQRTAGPERTPRGSAQKARAERKAGRNQFFKGARPTANMFEDIPEYEDPWQDPQPRYFSQFNPDQASQPREETFTHGWHPSAAYTRWYDPQPPREGDDLFSVPKAGPSGSQRNGRESFQHYRADGAFTDEDGDDDEDDDGESSTDRAARIAESRRKLAEFEREERQKKADADFAQRQARRKAEREDQERRAKAAEEQQRKRQEKWKRYQEQQRNDAEERQRQQYNSANGYSRTYNAGTSSYWSYSDWANDRTQPKTSSGGTHSRTFQHAKSAAREVWTPNQALVQYNTLCQAFDASKFAEQKPLALAEIPWPHLSRPPVSIADIDWDSVGNFFSSVKPLLTAADYKTLVDKSHKRFHPDRWRARTGAFKYIEGSDERRAEVEKKVNMVSQVITPLWSDMNR